MNSRQQILVLLLFVCLQNSCREKCINQTWGIGATLIGIAYAVAFDKSTFAEIDENNIMMTDGDTLILGYLPNYNVDWNKKKCSSEQPEHSEYKFKCTKILFRSIGNFDASHPDGSDISKFFRIDSYDYLPPDSFQFMDEYNIAENLPNFMFHLIKKPDPGMIKIQLKLYTNQEDDGISCLSRELHFKN